MPRLHIIDGKPVVLSERSSWQRVCLFVAAPIRGAWQHRDLILAILQRELHERFKGSVAGWVWAVVAPLLSLLTYTLVFRGAVRLPNDAEASSGFDYALFIFGGLIAFNYFSEMAYRAPTLLHEYSHFIKNTIFPTDMLPLISTLRAGVYASIGIALMVAAQLFLAGRLPWTVVLLPIWAVMLVLFLIGMTWVVSALGVFTRDVSYFMMSVGPLLMMTTPIFFARENLQEPLKTLIYANLITAFVEIVRDLVVSGKVPPLGLCCWVAGITAISFWGGYWFFSKYRQEVVDVL